MEMGLKLLDEENKVLPPLKLHAHPKGPQLTAYLMGKMLMMRRRRTRKGFVAYYNIQRVLCKLDLNFVQ